jgi:hypothetical protein
MSNARNVQPINPAQVLGMKESTIPDAVIKSFNKLISENFSNSSSSFTAKEVVNRILEKMPLSSSEEIYNNHWLDVEDIYRKVGWIVKYDQYEARFTFSVE